MNVADPFPTGNIPNGTRASGGTMAFITDDPGWGYAIDVWHLHQNYANANNYDWIYASYFKIEQTTAAPGCFPVNTGSFSGDVFSTRVSGGVNPTSYTGVDRVFVNGSTDPIWRVTFKLDTPVILAPGEYYGGHDRVLAPEPATLLLMGLGLGGAVLRSRRKQ